MKLINQSAQYLPQQAGIDGIYKQIELAGRTSYLSWDKMTDDSANKFMDMLIKSKHYSVLEQGTIYLNIGNNLYDTEFEHDACKWNLFIQKYRENPYSKLAHNTHIDGASITTNLRVLQENGWLDDLKYFCEPTEFHEKRLSVKVVTSRGISHELVRHRSMSFIQESQRYVEYTKDRFEGEITYIIPHWLDFKEGKYYRDTLDGFYVWTCDGEYVNTQSENRGGTLFLSLLNQAEYFYKRFCSIEYNLKPQQARDILPNATKTTLVITAFESDWRDWFDKRLFSKTGQPHPDMLVLANLIKQEFEKAGVWEGIIKYPSKYE